MGIRKESGAINRTLLWTTRYANGRPEEMTNKIRRGNMGTKIAPKYKAKYAKPGGNDIGVAQWSAIGAPLYVSHMEDMIEDFESLINQSGLSMSVARDRPTTLEKSQKQDAQEGLVGRCWNGTTRKKKQGRRAHEQRWRDGALGVLPRKTRQILRAITRTKEAERTTGRQEKPRGSEISDILNQEGGSADFATTHDIRRTAEKKAQTRKQGRRTTTTSTQEEETGKEDNKVDQTQKDQELPGRGIQDDIEYADGATELIENIATNKCAKEWGSTI